MKLLPRNLISRLLGRVSDKITDAYKQTELSFCELNPDARLLDCGCGDGEFALEKARKSG